MTWLDVYARAGRGVKIGLAWGCHEPYSRIELSSGTRAVKESDFSAQNYDPEACLPNEPWRRPTDEEIAHLVLREPPQDMGRTVQIVHLPPVARDRQQPPSFATGGGRRAAGKVDAEIRSCLETACDLGAPVTFIGLTDNSPNLNTTTIDRANDLYIGLHVDNWAEAALERRAASINRICVNLGEEDRFFLFLPVAVTEIAELVATEIGPDDTPQHDLTDLGRIFMVLFPDIPVVRCRVTPGEAYIAPTENLVHDGSSLGQSRVDMQYTVLGHIRLRSRDRS